MLRIQWVHYEFERRGVEDSLSVWGRRFDGRRGPVTLHKSFNVGG